MSIFTNWGSIPEEHELSYKCDSFINGSKESYFRAIDIKAPKEFVYSWLCQMKIAPYSYDRLDNGGKRSPQEITPGLTNLEIGDKMMTIFSVVDFAANAEITLLMDFPPEPYKKLYVPTSITYRLLPSRDNDKNHTRLVVKYTASWRHNLHDKLERIGVILADFIMMRKQLLNFKKLSERDYINSKKNIQSN